MENYAKLQMRNIIILLTIGLFVSFIPIHVMADSASGSDTMPINPYPDKIYGAEFRSAESPLGVAWDFAHNDLTNSNNNTDWNVEFFLTRAQMDQLTQWEQNDCNMSVIEAFSALVPNQVAALPIE